MGRSVTEICVACPKQYVVYQQSPRVFQNCLFPKNFRSFLSQALYSICGISASSIALLGGTWGLSKWVSLLKISRDSVLRLPFPSPTAQLGSLWGLRRMKLMEGAPAFPGFGPARPVFSQVFLVPLYVPCSQCLLSQTTWWGLGKGACGGRVEMFGK